MSVHTVDAPSLPSTTTVGTVRLTVSELARSQAFYERVLGLDGRPLDDGGLALFAADAPTAGARPLVELHADASAPRASRRATGLFHLALLFPDRRALAFALARLATH